jgi:hypothetical protein
MKLVICWAWSMTFAEGHPILNAMTKIVSHVQASMELWTVQTAESPFGQLAVWKILRNIIQVCHICVWLV